MRKKIEIQRGLRPYITGTMMHITRTLICLLALVFCCPWTAHAKDNTDVAMFTRLNALVASGNPELQYSLGMMLNNGIGTAQDNQAAFRYFLEAAKGGNQLAAFKVGCYYSGQFAGVVERNDELALKFLLPVAAAGYDNAQAHVAMYYKKKLGDVNSALIWWERASRQGNLASTAYLAEHFSASASTDKAKGLALMLILKERMPKSTPQLLEGIASLESELTAAEKIESERIHSTWMGAPSAITLQARAGFANLPALLAALER